MTLTVGSLFSGIGGLELGLEAAGMHTVWQVENNPYCQAQLAKHWPDVTRYGDVKDVGAHNLAPVDIICGGFPCQDISYAGKGAGLVAGSRSSLWFEFARIVGEMAPRYAVVENVPALLTRGIDHVLGTLADLGYDAEWTHISAADMGAPHLRKRIFIVAYANSRRREQRDAGLGRDAESGAGHPPLVDADGLERRERDAEPRNARGTATAEQERRQELGSRRPGMVDAESRGRGEGRRLAVRRTDGGRQELGDTDQGHTRRDAGAVRRAEAPPQPEGRDDDGRNSHGSADAGSAVGAADRRGQQQREGQMGEIRRRLADGSKELPSWEDATPVRGADGTVRLIPRAATEAGPQSPLWPVADGLPGRVARLSAIGNAVVPKVALQIGLRIRQLEAAQ